MSAFHCSCGFAIDDANRGNDAETHVPIDTNTPVRLYFRDTGRDNGNE